MIPADGAQTIGPTSGGKVTPINSLNTAMQIILAGNPQRSSISFHNPGTVVVYVAPLLNALGQTFTPTLSALGGTFQIGPGATLTLGGECQFGWQALAAIGVNNPLTVMESNV